MSRGRRGRSNGSRDARNVAGDARAASLTATRMHRHLSSTGHASCDSMPACVSVSVDPNARVAVESRERARRRVARRGRRAEGVGGATIVGARGDEIVRLLAQRAGERAPRRRRASAAAPAARATPCRADQGARAVSRCAPQHAAVAMRAIWFCGSSASACSNVGFDRGGRVALRTRATRRARRDAIRPS